MPNDLHQQLLELIYDLLTEDEAAALRQRIEMEPAVAEAYANAKQTAEKLAAAARLQAPPVPLQSGRDEGHSAADHFASAHTVLDHHAPNRSDSDHQPAHSVVSGNPPAQKPRDASIDMTSRPPARSGFARWAQWGVALASAALVVVAVGGFAYNRSQLASLDAKHLRLIVTGPTELEPGIENSFSLRASTVSGQPAAVPVTYAVSNANGQALMERKAFTNSDGALQISLPADLDMSRGARLEVLAVHHAKLVRMQTPLPVKAERLVTQLSLDKPLYQPGETVYFRSLTLSRFGLRVDSEVEVHFQILDPSGAVVPGSESTGYTQSGVGSGGFDIPSGLAGGEYILVAKSPVNLFPDEQRPFFVRRYRLPRLKKDLEFARDSYTPGEEVVADFSVNRAEGGPAANAALRIIATVDGQTAFEHFATASSSGTFQVTFPLPKQIEKGDGQLAVIVDDGGTRETLAKTIPINLGKLDVRFYPEGGDLVAGLSNRVYFTGKDLVGEPVHLEGRILDEAGKQVAELETTHEGLGSFEFTPAIGTKYHVKLTKPAGIVEPPKLPQPNADRQLVLSTGSGVFDMREPIALEIASVKAKIPLVVAAYCRGVQVGQTPLTTRVGLNKVSLAIADEAAGVIRVTVFDYSSTPPAAVAERLVYRRPDRKLNVRVADHSEGYSPGESVDLSLMVTNEKGLPVAAALGVSVVDDSLLKLADDDTASMPTHFYLTTEVEKPEDLEEADFYLTDAADATVALDLLLGTQGWRRFVEKTLPELEQEGANKDELTRLVALGGSVTPPSMFDNYTEVKLEYAHDLQAYSVARREAFLWLGRVCFFGALAVVIGLMALAVSRIRSEIRLWVPAFAVSATCLILGFFWMNGSPQRGAMSLGSAFSTNPVEVASTPSEISSMKGLVGHVMDTEPEMAKKAYAAAPGAAVQAPALFGDQMKRGIALPQAPRLAMNDELLEKQQLQMDRKDFRKMLGQDKLRAEPLEREANGRGRGFAGGAWKDAQRRNRQLARNAAALADLEEQVEADRIRFTMREYAHQHIASEPGLRTDFTETLFWSPLIVADANGQARIHFDLADSVTTFRIMADAHDGAGRIGSGQGELLSRIPFSLEPKLPLQVTAGDQIDLPVAINNDSANNLPVILGIDSGELLQLSGAPERRLELDPQQRVRTYFPLTVTGKKGNASVELRGLAGSLADATRRTIEIVPSGFPHADSYSGTLAGEQEVTVELPEGWVAGSLEVTLSAFPSTLADLQEGMDSILREPYGCFEQASTSNYPNVLSMQYMQEHKIANPEITRRSKELLTNGYSKLTSYECPEKGFEWFGGDPGHEALTAYGLMEFRDMAQVHDVNEDMIQRTANWLLKRRDGKGGFLRNPRALDSFGGAPAEITDAYIVWALTESRQQGIEREVEHVIDLGKKSDDPYLVALAAASAANSKQTDAAQILLNKLKESQQADGHLDGKQGSITRSGGISLSVETTSLAALAWMKVPGFQLQSKKAIEWITQKRQGGGFGSTQATILALKALVAQAQSSRKTVTGGELVLNRNGTTVGTRTFGAGEENAITLDGIEAKLEPGKNSLTIKLTGENEMPYVLDVQYRSHKPASHPACPVQLSTALSSSQVKAGETVALQAQLVNKTGDGQPMTIAILGLPAGLQPRADQLEELKKAGVFDYYETRAREVICYWRSLAPNRKVDIKLDLVAEWPGRYLGPASQTYLYYTAEQKHWVDGLSIEILRD